MTAKKVSSDIRKINVVIMLTADEIKFLDRKISKGTIASASRSALIRALVHQAMLNPDLLRITA